MNPMEEKVAAEIEKFVREAPENRFPESGECYFEGPLVGIAAADDPLFAEYQRIIGPFHRTPREILENAASVVVWVLPVSANARMSNRREKNWPSREWAHTRHHGENFNSILRRHMIAWLEAAGHRALAPQLAPGWQQMDESPVGIASTWSERHAAYAAGLGTFSLNDGLITCRGIAHRLGSVITDLSLNPTPRPWPDYHHNCLWFREGSCGACIGRCPVGAITRQGHDKAACRGYVYGSVPGAVGAVYGVTQTGCGLCQTGVPCEDRIPAGRSRVKQGTGAVG